MIMHIAVNGVIAEGENGPIEFCSFAYDGCHKVYLCESDKDIEEAEGFMYEIHEAFALPEIWRRSCDLRFINTWNLETVVEQCQEATIEIVD